MQGVHSLERILMIIVAEGSERSKSMSEYIKREDVERAVFGHLDPNGIDTDSYIGIDDYTCDIDNPEEVEHVLEHIKTSL